MEFNITPKEIYEALNLDNEILKIYKEIENKEIKEGCWAFHNFEHIKNVSKIAEKLLKDLNFDEITIYKCKIACLLHDIGVLQGKEEHAQRSCEYAIKLFENKNWKFEDLESVLDAIKNHSAGFETDNIVGLALILADKLDIKKRRISELGKEVKGNRQYAHIEDITINIKNNILTINFITDGQMIMKEVNSYYFTEKVFKAIEAFAQKLNLEYYILIDNKIWDNDKIYFTS